MTQLLVQHSLELYREKERQRKVSIKRGVISPESIFPKYSKLTSSSSGNICCANRIIIKPHSSHSTAYSRFQTHPCLLFFSSIFASRVTCSSSIALTYMTRT